MIIIMIMSPFMLDTPYHLVTLSPCHLVLFRKVRSVTPSRRTTDGELQRAIQLLASYGTGARWTRTARAGARRFLRFLQLPAFLMALMAGAFLDGCAGTNSGLRFQSNTRGDPSYTIIIRWACSESDLDQNMFFLQYFFYKGDYKGEGVHHPSIFQGRGK